MVILDYLKLKAKYLTLDTPSVFPRDFHQWSCEIWINTAPECIITNCWASYLGFLEVKVFADGGEESAEALQALVVMVF